MLKDRKGPAGCQGERGLCNLEEETEEHQTRTCEAEKVGTEELEDGKAMVRERLHTEIPPDAS